MRAAAATALVLLLGAGGFLGYMKWSLRHMHIGFFTRADVDRLMAQAEVARLAVLRNRDCLFTVDESSMGDKKTEGEMSYAAAMLDFYSVKFGTAASSIADLDKLRDFDHASKLNGRQLEKDCSLYADPSGSYVVSCGPSKPSSADVSTFMRNADFAKRFYKLGSREILYVPAPKC
jgi:hypothetical protein